MRKQVSHLLARQILGEGVYRLYAPIAASSAEGECEEGDAVSLRVDSAGNVRAADGADRGGEEE